MLCLLKQCLCDYTGRWMCVCDGGQLAQLEVYCVSAPHRQFNLCT